MDELDIDGEQCAHDHGSVQGSRPARLRWPAVLGLAVVCVAVAGVLVIWGTTGGTDSLDGQGVAGGKDVAGGDSDHAFAATPVLRDVAEASQPPGLQEADNPIDCLDREGHLPLLEGEHFPDAQTVGAPSPEAAVAHQSPDAEITETVRYGGHPQAPIWVVAGDETFSVAPLPDGGWFATPASFLGCAPWEELALSVGR